MESNINMVYVSCELIVLYRTLEQPILLKLDAVDRISFRMQRKNAQIDIICMGAGKSIVFGTNV